MKRDKPILKGKMEHFLGLPEVNSNSGAFFLIWCHWQMARETVCSDDTFFLTADLPKVLCFHKTNRQNYSLQKSLKASNRV